MSQETIKVVEPMSVATLEALTKGNQEAPRKPKFPPSVTEGTLAEKPAANPNGSR